MTKFQLFRCERLSASISRSQCEKNAARQYNGFTGIPEMLACRGCSGLGDPVELEIDMAKREPIYGTCPTCKRENVMLTWKGKDCHRCYKRKQNGQDPLAPALKNFAKMTDPKPAPDDPEIPKTEDIAVNHTEEQVTDAPPSPLLQFGLVTNSDDRQVPFGVDALVYQALTEAFETLKASWLCELSGLSPIKALALAHKMVETIQGVGY